MVVVGRQDFTTCLLGPPPSPIRDGARHLVTPLRGFQYQIGFTNAGVLGSSSIYCLARQDMTTDTHARLAVSIGVQESIPLLSDIATLPRVHVINGLMSCVK
jgi:hypothetical protein